jgi:Asp-tRNA(Asn)/Glu-tRNA(Gln) amidotransferase A subunit family amidase
MDRRSFVGMTLGMAGAWAKARKPRSMPMTVTEASEQLRRKKISPVDLTEECLRRISALNPHLNAFITVTAESARTEARSAEAEIKHGNWRGALHGIPLALKDNIDTAGVLTTAGSKVFGNRVPREDAEVVRRVKAAGAIILGKTNLHEFAYGGSSVVSAYGPVRNPRDRRHITGGSSGGSAAAVASGMCLAALGTDTAGSIREPAACCGVVGLKPTYGRVSSRGVIPLSASLDHTGPITQCVADAALVLQVLAGYDSGDPASAQRAVPDFSAALEKPVRTLRIGIPRKFFYEDLDSDVGRIVENAVTMLSKRVASARDVALEVPTDRTLQSGESYAYHADSVAKTPELYQPETLRRIRSGSEISRETMEEKRKELRRLREGIEEVFRTVDVLLTPAIPIPAPELQPLLDHPENLRPVELLLLRNTRPFNVWGLPSLSVPCGLTPTGLPVGLQISAAPWREDLVLALGHTWEQMQ